MAAEASRRRSEAFTYSWAMPAPGSAHEPEHKPAEVPEPAGDTSSGVPDQEAAHVVEAYPAHSQESANQQSGAGQSLVNKLSLRPTALIAWNGLAASGAAYLLLRSGPFPGLQLGELAGVWAGIAAVVWFLPTRLAEQHANSRIS